MEKSDHDSVSNRNHSPRRQSDSSVPAAAAEAKMDSSNESAIKQSHPVPDSQDRREEDLPSHPHTPPSSSEKQPSATQDATPPQTLPVHRNQEPLTPRGQQQTEAESNDDGTPSKQRRCKCKASRCLKLYCECFASGSYCNGCNCLKCQNNLENEAERQEAIKAILERNPGAFKRKIGASPQEDVSQLVTLGKHSRGCNCKRSGCLKKYCECYQANVRCSENCRCRHCKNFEGSQDIKQTTNATVELAIDLPQSRKIKAASHSVADRGSSAVPHVQDQTVNYVVRNGDTSLFTVPNNRVVSGSTAPTYSYRSSQSDTNQLRHAKELCSLLVSKSVEVANKMSDCVLDAGRMDEKPMSPATRALMCDEKPVTISEKEASVRVRTSQEKEDTDTSSEVYAEQENQILSNFRDHLMQLFNRGSINGTNIQKANTDPSRKEPEDEEQSHGDSSLGS
ncbi:protein tesmin/TSO1-like CXC 7 isoform X2 [Brassica napus]|uniref:protein tesmin/TSO1-like CXC 7 isoform X2 n=1 Tax=Brassica napus TaxID=3708 RepID=UPI002078A0A6|nr:protein tesmin/TSO1-like CXC 7 isoform X2 [Brassica napus]